MDIEMYEAGAPSWVELGTPDVGAVSGFYEQLLGWQPRPGAPDTELGVTWLLRDRPVAAVAPVPAADRPRWTTYVSVADLDETVEKALSAGGRVLEAAADRSPAGRSALLADHAGTRFGIWQAGQYHDVGVSGELGVFSWGELITDDVEASRAFYRAVFGWTLTEPDGPLGRREWQLGGRSVSGLLPRPPAMPADIPPYWDVYFAVADASAAVETVARLGGTTLMPATPIGHGTIAVFTDPAGAVFTVIAAAH